jgi:anti-sigma regulatory factor (Ser/Thr protein kinase)
MIRSLTHQHNAASFPATPVSAGLARQFVANSLRDAGVEGAVAQRLILVTSELVTNAVVHACSQVEVRVVVDSDDVCLAVLDEEPRHPRQVPSAQAGTSGRGLVLVNALVDEWGVSEIPGSLGKIVWARVSRA